MQGKEHIGLFPMEKRNCYGVSISIPGTKYIEKMKPDQKVVQKYC